jgi:hypothetical protein
MKSKSKVKTKSDSPTLIRFDWAMKRLLRQKANFAVLEGFLSVFLNEEVKIINIKDSESNQEHPEDKFNRVDILVENSHNELLIIEIQNSEEVDYFLRMLYGVSKTISEHIMLGEPYSKVRKVYHINIVYFKLGHGKDYVYCGGTEFRGIHYGDVLQLTEEQKDFFAGKNRHNVKDVKDLFPGYFLLCVENFDKVAKSGLDEWMYYLKNNSIPDEFTAPGLREAKKRLQYDELSEEEKRAYDHHLKQRLYEQNSIDTARWKGEYRGEAKGLAKGKAERDRLRAKLKAEKAEKEAMKVEKEAMKAKFETEKAEKEAAQAKEASLLARIAELERR